MAYVCSYCVNDFFTAPSEVLLLNHIRLVHSKDPNFSIQCQSENCSRTFTNFRTFQNHRRSCSAIDSTPHGVLGETICESGDQHGEDIINDVLPTSSDLQMYCAKWILRMSETRALTRTATLGVVDDVRELVDVITEGLKSKTSSILQSNGVPDYIVSDVEDTFSSRFVQPFDGLQTFHQQLQYYRQNFGLIVSFDISS